MILNQTYLGKLEDRMVEIPDNSVQMIFADFPYVTTKASWDTPVDLEIFWQQANRILKDNGVVVATAQFPFTAILAMSNLKDLRYDWVWEKTQATGHLNAKKMPMKSHESVLIFYKKLPIYNPIKTQGHQRKVSTAHHKRNTSTGELYGKCDNFSSYDSTERYPRTVLKFASDKQKLNLHSTQKPVALVEYFIETYTNEGDTVLDPCAGSGTTKIAAINKKRNWICIEKEQKFVDIINNRTV